MTIEEAETTRNEWITTFTEMADHMRPQKAKNVRVAFKAYGLERHEADEEEEEDDGGRDYMAVLPCGQVRNRCSYNAACLTRWVNRVNSGKAALVLILSQASQGWLEGATTNSIPLDQ